VIGESNFADSVIYGWYLTEGYAVESIDAKLGQLIYKAGGSNAKAGLNEILLNYFNGNELKSGDRPGVPNVLFFLSDGVYDGWDDPVPMADKLREYDTSTGREPTDIWSIVNINYPPPKLHVLDAISGGNPLTNFTDYGQLADVFKQLYNDTCCRNVTRPPPPGECCCGDIVYVVDESDSIGIENFELVRQFLEDLTSKFGYGRRLTESQFALVNFSSEAVVRAHWSREYPTKDSFIYDGIKNLPYYHPSNTNTGAALRKVRDEVLTDDMNRACKDVVILFTDGAPTGAIDPFGPAMDICNTGATMLVVGIGRINETVQLRLACNISENVYNFTDFTSLSVDIIKKAIDKQTCRKCPTMSCKNKVDTLFVGDRRNITDEQEQMVSDFWASMAQAFDAPGDSQKVAMVSYDIAARNETDFATASKLQVETIRNVSYADWNIVQTDVAKALSYAKDYIETSSSIHQNPIKFPRSIVVMMSGEDKHDMAAKTTADELRESGICVLVATVNDTGAVDPAFALAIAGDKKNVKNFGTYYDLDLNADTPVLVTAICDHKPLCECKWVWKIEEGAAQDSSELLCPSRTRRLPFFMRGLDEDDEY
jgi:uncharacterized protein YegL